MSGHVTGPICASCGAPRPAANVSLPIAACACGSTTLAWDEVHVHTEEDFAALIPPAPPLRIVPSPTPRRLA